MLVSMKSPVVSLLGLLVLVAPASAETVRHRHPHHGRAHIVGTHARHGEAGFPITAAKDSIRINAVGEVISQPVPVIQKERNFNTRANQDLTGRPQAPQASPQAPPSSGTPAQP